MIYFSSYAKSRVNPRQQHWFALRGKIFEIVDKSCLLFYLSTDGNIKILQYYIFFSIYCINVLTDGYNRWQFFIFMHKVAFLFLPFFNFGTQITCSQNWNADLKSTLDQPLIDPPKMGTSAEGKIWFSECSSLFLRYFFQTLSLMFLSLFFI